MYWYIRCLKKAFDFKGRARRKEYWTFVGINLIIYTIAMLIDLKISEEEVGKGPVVTALKFIFLIPGVSVSVRRLHDIGKSGWYFLVNLIPLIGSIWFLILTAKEGDDFENFYGKDPKAINAEYEIIDDEYQNYDEFRD